MKNRLISTTMAVLIIPCLLLAQQEMKDWIKNTSKNGKVTITMPPSWTITDNVSAEKMSEMEKTNPKMAKAFRDGMKAEYELSAVDSSVTTGDNMNVHIRPNAGVTEKMYGELGKAILAQPPFNGKGEHKVMSYPFGKALRYSAEIVLKDPQGADLPMSTVGYLTLKGDNIIFFTFVALSSSGKEERQKVIEAMMKTVTIAQ